MRRSQPHTELLVEEFELGTLWDEYGLVGDIIICPHFHPFLYLDLDTFFLAIH